jgi:hypothetical protein
MTIEQEIAAGLHDLAKKFAPRKRITLADCIAAAADLQPMLILTESDIEENAVATRGVAKSFQSGERK